MKKEIDQMDELVAEIEYLDHEGVILSEEEIQRVDKIVDRLYVVLNDNWINDPKNKDILINWSNLK